MSNFRFHSADHLHIGATVKLNDNAATHATRALRLEVGDSIQLFNGDGVDYICELISVKKNEVIAKVNASQICNTESPLNITLLQGISSGDRMDYTIQKAVELGVKVIQPIATERSVVKLSAERAEKRLEHWQNIVISACEQCGRATIPQVLAPKTLANWLTANPVSTSSSNVTRILLNPIGAKRLAALDEPNGEIQLLIGAEGGLSQAEINLAISQGFQSVILGPRILRTETAGPTAIATLQSLWGDF
ncbi:MAG: 16S rRNA (uracil(1498)-N(3))-methyltransferase [Methylotenera sp.]|uniref:16S rRNA (uracil(1498)-N(3))-methyltransferase n=1 Tax=Methylotenera sp. TaxID=2051956 RepID=UPI002487CECC|nr:16S rRNA (uracil(1498)-N(3))-methyltransferase [Methylotenera sp.]MDI1309788.1 16S rRNA (uracil(1498)-N(3))-methyltransferase [Methylotenera sp.]